MGISKMGGSGLKVKAAAAVVVCIWIYNVAFNIPVIWADVRTDDFGRTTCSAPDLDPLYLLAGRILSFFLPLFITWSSYIGIIYKFKHSTSKVQ